MVDDTDPDGRLPLDDDATAEVPFAETDEGADADSEAPAAAADTAATEPDTNRDDADLAAGESILDEYTSEDYLSATTTEYQGLAEAVRKSETEQYELQAVAAAMPGVDTGLVGFEDVTGEAPIPAPEEPKEPTDLPARVASALVLAGLLFGSLWAGGAWFGALVSVVAVIALGEFYVSIRRVGYVPIALFGLLGTIAVMVAAWFGGPGGIAGTLIVFTMVILLWYSVLVRKHPLENASLTIFGMIWVGGGLGFATALGRADAYVPLVLLLVLSTAFFDIGSFFVGRSVGKRPLAPVLSPNKTVEGLAGGVLAAAAAGTVLTLTPWFEPVTFTGALVLAAGVSVSAPLGDLAESTIKRSLGVKDMGSLLPGHGGLLDRIDALLFTVPVGYLIFELLGYLG